MMRSSLALVSLALALVTSVACGSGRDVHGGLRAYRITDGAQVFAPIDLRMDRFIAYVDRDERFETFTGVGYQDGVFIIVDVPEGEYLLRHDSDALPTFYATASDDIDLSSASLGRTDLRLPAASTTLELEVGGLAPWAAGDRLELVSANQGLILDPLAFTSTRAPAPGDARLDALRIDFADRALPMVDAALGDRLLLTQLERSTTEGGERLVLTRAFEAPPVSLTEGAVTTSSGAFGAVAPAPPVEVALDAAALASLRSQVHPEALPMKTSVRVETLLGAGQFGRYSSAPLLGQFEAVGVDGFSATLEFGDPFPAAWDDLAVVEVVHGVPLRAPGATQTATLTTAYQTALSLESLRAEAAFAPRLGPPTAPTLEDGDARGPLTGVGETPRLAWSAPRLGTARVYVVTLWRISAMGAATVLEPQARLFTSDLSIRLPPGLISRGQLYAAVITAFDDPARDVGRAPFRLSLPASSAGVITAPFSP